MSKLDKILESTTPDQRANDPILRKAFIIGLMASDIYAPVMDSEAEQAENGGVSLMATAIDEEPHVLLFSSEEHMKAFLDVGTRFAKVAGHDLFPMLIGNNAILNPGPTGLKLTPEDIAEINGNGPS